MTFDVTDFRDYSRRISIIKSMIIHMVVEQEWYLKPEPLFDAVEALSEGQKSHHVHSYVSARRTIYAKESRRTYRRKKHLVFICGHYEGYDERIREHLVTDEISIGDFVLTGGELAAMAVIDSVVRLLPDVLGQCGFTCTRFIFNWLARTSSLYTTS